MERQGKDRHDMTGGKDAISSKDETAAFETAVAPSDIPRVPASQASD